MHCHVFFHIIFASRRNYSEPAGAGTHMCHGTVGLRIQYIPSGICRPDLAEGVVAAMTMVSAPNVLVSRLVIVRRALRELVKPAHNTQVLEAGRFDHPHVLILYCRSANAIGPLRAFSLAASSEATSSPGNTALTRVVF